MLTRRLVLRSEHLSDLTSTELEHVNAAAGGTGPQPTPPYYGPPTLHAEECVNTTNFSVYVCSVGCITFAQTCVC
ncbi:MAG TPA: hypothetical protein VF519_10350 [Mycobacteriales bacterium]|jgi:hypothetical protein